ncbi:unnamed protein product [Dovyalis caffra]|uniref:Uncharacterized protein n=1 Tax=Dovyalis caffra TaxID=77055 RepID=A0AAV1RR08_9ROSI|nr:unnamed protein product [Dovyalis caffra]
MENEKARSVKAFGFWNVYLVKSEAREVKAELVYRFPTWLNKWDILSSTVYGYTSTQRALFKIVKRKRTRGEFEVDLPDRTNSLFP